MKIFLYIPICLVFLFNITGTFFLFKIQQYGIRKEIKRQIKEGVPEGELHQFILSKNQYANLDWVRPGLEFRFGKEMFDIVRTENMEGEIKLHCVNDFDEALLFIQLDRRVEKKIEQESKTPNSALNSIGEILKIVYLKWEFKESLIHFVKRPSQNFVDLENNYSSIYLEIHTPPPDIV